MKINSIVFTQGEEGAIPSDVTVTMSVLEAAAIAKVFGSFNDLEFEKRGIPRLEVYNDLCGDVFNRYWDDGLDGAMRELMQLKVKSASAPSQSQFSKERDGNTNVF